MLEVLVVFTLASVAIRFLERAMVKKIAFAKDTQEAILGRRKLLALRWRVIILVFGIYLLFLIAISDFREPDTYKQFMWVICAIITIGKQYGFKKLLGNISTLTKSAFLSENKDFVLFLRGFTDDDYSDIGDIKKKDFENFSEYGFMSLLEYQNISACAIGMTKESDSPIGAKRIYVDDVSWKNDVEELMEMSKCIYILVRNRESCLWEIVTALKYLKKITFIVDDIAQYNLVREQIQDRVELPIIATPPVGAITVLTYGDGKFNAVLYSNSIEGYGRMLNIASKPLKKITKKIEKEKVALPKDRKTILFVLVGFVVFFVLVVALNIYFEYDKIKDDNKKRVEAIAAGNLVLSHSEKQEIITGMRKEYDKMSTAFPMTIDENTLLKSISIDEYRQIVEYDIVGLKAEDVDLLFIQLNLIRGFTKQQLGVFRGLGIELIYRYCFDDEVQEIRFTREDINKMCENMEKSEIE